jgi:HK97 family phage major capsid protein
MGGITVTSIPERIAAVAVDRETIGRTKEFAMLCRCAMLARGNIREAEMLARKDRAPERVVNVVRAAVDPLSISSVGEVLAPFQLLAQAFLASLASVTAFDSMLPFMPPFPPRSKIVSTTTQITGVSLAERDVKRISSLSLAASDLDIAKAAGQFVISREAIQFGVEGALQYLENQLRLAVAGATDTQFLTLITSGATSIPSSGGNANGARLDLRAALQSINIGSGSRLFLIVHPDISAAWSVLGDSQGGVVFPLATYNGGTIGGIRIIASDSCPAQQIILADASRIAAFQEPLRVDASEQASIQMDSSPDSPPTASSNMLSLWQLNQVGIIIERFFGAKVLNTNAVVMVTGANYTGGSPS